MTTAVKKSRGTNGRASGELLDAKLPSDWTSEANVVAAMIIHPKILDEPLGLHSGLFSHEDTRTIFNAILQLRADREPVDSTHLAMRLKRLGVWDSPVGGAERFAHILQHSVVPSLFGHYLDHARQLWKRREMIYDGMKMIQAAHSRDAIEGPIAELKANLEYLEADPRGRVRTYRTLSCAELDKASVEIEYLVAETLAAGQPAILAGPPKSLKTSLSTDLALSLATGTPFLGVYEVPRPLRVVFMSGESGEAASRVCFRSVATTKGYDLADVENLFWSDEVPRIGTPEHVLCLRGHLSKYRPDVVLIDPAYRALSAARPEDMFAMGELLGSMNDIVADAGATLVLVHHSRKQHGAPFAPTTLDDLSWAGFREFFRQWLLLSRRARYETGSGVHELRIDVGGSARHSWCAALTVDEGPFHGPRWQVEVRGIAEAVESEQAKSEARRKESQTQKQHRDLEKLLGAAKVYPAGETLRTLREHAGLSGTAATAALATALQSGALVKCQIAKNRKHVDGFKLPEE